MERMALGMQRKMTVVGVDLGASNVRFILYSQGHEKSSLLVPLTARTPHDLEQLVVGGVRTMLSRGASCGLTVSAIGVGCAGLVNRERGVLVLPPNMPSIRNVAIGDAVRSATGLPSFVDNDGNCALLAESVSGVARGKRNVIMFAVGTGIGGALMLNGRLYTGRIGFAGEVGHIPVMRRGLRCGCGNIGCLETVASGTGIQHYVQRAAAGGAATAMSPTEMLSAVTIGECAKRGDHLAQRAFSRAAYYLGVAGAGLVNTLAPDMIVLGGGVSESGLLHVNMDRTLRAKSLSLIVESVSVVLAHNGSRAGAIGAACLAERLAGGQPLYLD
jgi:glucokinase